MRSTTYNQHCKERGQERDMEVEGDYGGFTATPPQPPVSCSSLVPSVVQGVGSLSGERAYRTENFVCATPATQRAASSAFSPFHPTPPGVPFVPLPPPSCKSSPASSGPKPPPIPQPLHSPPLPFPPLPFPNHSVYPDSALPPTTVTIDPDKPMSVGSSKKEVCRQVFQQIELFLQPRSAQTFEELR